MMNYEHTFLGYRAHCKLLYPLAWLLILSANGCTSKSSENYGEKDETILVSQSLEKAETSSAQEDTTTFQLSSLTFQDKPQPYGAIHFNLESNFGNAVLPEVTLLTLVEKNTASLTLSDTKLSSLKTELPYYSPKHCEGIEWLRFHETEGNVRVELRTKDQIKIRLIPSPKRLEIHFYEQE